MEDVVVFHGFKAFSTLIFPECFLEVEMRKSLVIYQKLLTMISNSYLIQRFIKGIVVNRTLSCLHGYHFTLRLQSL